jgi:AAA domain
LSADRPPPNESYFRGVTAEEAEAISFGDGKPLPPPLTPSQSRSSVRAPSAHPSELAPGAASADGRGSAVPDAPPPDRRLRLRPLADVKPRKVRWLVPGMIPLRTITLVAGVGGLGKSTYLAARAAEVSSGKLLDGTPADVVIVTFEDPAAEVLRPRIEAALGDVRRVHEIVVDQFDGIDPVRLPTDVAEVQRLVRDVGAKLLIIDPIVAAIDTQLDSHKDQHVRVVLSHLADLADDADCAISIVGHLNKAPSRDAYIRVANSVAFWNAARSVVLVTEDNGDEALRLVAQRKANWARLGPVERHRIEEIQLEQLDPETGDPIVTSRMVFVEEADDVDGADVLSPRVAPDEATKELSAAGFLVRRLAGGDWFESAQVKAAALAGGVSERTLQRAKLDLGVEDKREGFPAVSYWRLPQSRQGSPQDGGGTGGAAWLSENGQAELPVAPPHKGGASGGTTGGEGG